jgi:hypothetical protein
MFIQSPFLVKYSSVISKFDDDKNSEDKKNLNLP